MTPPPYLLGLSLVAWGWLTQRPLASLLLIVLVEGCSRLRVRWAFDDREFERVTDLTSIAFALFVVWQWFASKDAGSGILGALSWMPALLAPLVVMQRLSSQGAFPMSALFWSMRRSRERHAHRRLALDYPYFCHVLIAMACVAPTSLRLGPVAAGLCGYALWTWRRAGVRPWVWGAVMATVLAVAAGIAVGVTAAQRAVEEQVLAFFQDRLALRAQADRSRTAIGELGHLEQSSQIVLRVRGEEGSRPPRLRNGIFDSYHDGTWFAPSGPYRAARPDGDQGWVLHGSPPERRVTVAGWLEGGRGILPLPEGTIRLDALNVGSVETGAHGVVRVSQGPALIEFVAGFTPGLAADVPPTPRDLALPARLAAPLQGILAEAGAAGMDPRRDIARLTDFFQQRFRYTVRLGRDPDTTRPLETFLTTDRAGHCEYFATAAVLALRQLGIPSRYVTGHVVDEWSDREGAWLVRARHAHAWAQAWIDGGWVSVDVTPRDWLGLESALQDSTPVRDYLSWLHFQFTSWRLSDREGSAPSLWWLALVVPLGGWVLWGVVRRSQRTAVAARTKAQSDEPSWPEIGSLLSALEVAGHRRPPSRPLRMWLSELPGIPGVLHGRLRDWAGLHARWRYDPVSVPPDDAERLRTEAAALAREIREEHASRSGPR